MIALLRCQCHFQLSWSMIEATLALKIRCSEKTLALKDLSKFLTTLSPYLWNKMPNGCHWSNYRKVSLPSLTTLVIIDWHLPPSLKNFLTYPKNHQLTSASVPGLLCDLFFGFHAYILLSLHSFSSRLDLSQHTLLLVFLVLCPWITECLLSQNFHIISCIQRF